MDHFNKGRGSIKRKRDRRYSKTKNERNILLRRHSFEALNVIAAERHQLVNIKQHAPINHVGRIEESRYDKNNGSSLRTAKKNEDDVRSMKPTEETVKSLSLPAVYQFSWQVFQEDSYVDNISGTDLPSLIKPKCEDATNVLKDWIDVLKKSQEDDLQIAQEIFIPQVNDLFSDALDTRYPAIKCSYNEVLQKLFTVSDLVKQEKRRTLSDNAFVIRQHQLLLVALLTHSTKSTSTYKEAGSAELKWKYKRIFLLGDSRIHDLYHSDAWRGITLRRPHLICREDLSLFTLTKFITENINVSLIEKGPILVICSVALRDVVRTIDTFGVLVSIEITISEMKQIRREFNERYGNHSVLLFSDILPADINSMVQLHKDSMEVNVDSDKIALMNATTIKLVKFAYLLSKNMMVEDLSRLKHLPSWELFINPLKMKIENSNVALPSLKDGVNPDVEQFSFVGARIWKTFTQYNAIDELPVYNTKERAVFFVCNEKYLACEKFWPKAKMSEKPNFIFLKQVLIETVIQCLDNYFPVSGDCLLVIWLDINELFVPHIMKDRCDHENASLKLNIPSFIPPKLVFNQLMRCRREIEMKSGTSNVIFSTLCPLNFKHSVTNLLKIEKGIEHNFEPIPDNVSSTITDYHLAVVDKLNMYIVQSNRLRGLPSWDLCSNLYQRDRDGLLIFQVPLSPCTLDPVQPSTVGKLMMCISQFSQESIKALNWMSFLFKRIKSDQQQIKKRSPAFTGATRSPPRKRCLSYIKPQIRNEFLNSAMNVELYDSAPAYDINPTDELSAYFLNQSQLHDFHHYKASDHSVPQNASEQSNMPHYSAPAQYVHPGYVQPPTAITSQTGYPLPSTSSNVGDYVPQYPDDFYMPIANKCSNLSSSVVDALETEDTPTARSVFTSSQSTSNAQSSTSQQSSAKKIVRKLSTSSRKKISFSVKSKLDLVLGPVGPVAGGGKTVFADPAANPVEDPAQVEDENTLSLSDIKQIVSSLRTAHEEEITAFRQHPESHANYAEQHAEFIIQALDAAKEFGQTPNMSSIEKVWNVCWRSQIEKSFDSTWKQRVELLITMLSKDQKMSPSAIRALVAQISLTAISTAETDPDTKFNASETELLNRFKKKRYNQSVLTKEELNRRSGVILGEKLLGQVQQSWKSIGCKKSQHMLENAILKINVYMTKSNIVGPENDVYVNLSRKLNTFIEYLISKEGNPYDLDYDSIAEITTSFNPSEMAEYVAAEIRNRGIENAAVEDLTVICKAISARQKKPVYNSGFVKGDTLNPY